MVKKRADAAASAPKSSDADADVLARVVTRDRRAYLMLLPTADAADDAAAAEAYRRGEGVRRERVVDRAVPDSGCLTVPAARAASEAFPNTERANVGEGAEEAANAALPSSNVLPVLLDIRAAAEAEAEACSGCEGLPDAADAAAEALENVLIRKPPAARDEAFIFAPLDSGALCTEGFSRAATEADASEERLKPKAASANDEAAARADVYLAARDCVVEDVADAAEADRLSVLPPNRREWTADDAFEDSGAGFTGAAARNVAADAA